MVVSGDHYFMDLTTGVYTFDPSKLGEAHSQAQCQAIRAMQAGVENVIIDNTNARKWEWAVYTTAAQALGYEVNIIDLFDGGCTDEELAARNVHGVPANIIEAMRKKWEK